MSGLTEGERQRREINTYNLFYSSITDRADPSLAEHGIRIPMTFPTIGENAEPDFVLYDGQTCVLVEIKSGNNINDRDIRQMKLNSEVDIETLEDELRNARVRDKTGYDGKVTSKETVILYHDIDEGYIEENEESESFRRAIEELTEHAVLMTQDYGEELRVLEGEFTDDNHLQSLLKQGVELPKNPPDEIMLPEDSGREALAMAVCDIWGEKALDHEDGVEVTREEVRNHFSPQHNISIGDLDMVFEFLDDFGACEEVDEEENEHTYRFTRQHMEAILEVEQQVMKESIRDYLQGDNQTSFNENFE
jgi:hypothetical protein